MFGEVFGPFREAGMARDGLTIARRLDSRADSVRSQTQERPGPPS